MCPQQVLWLQRSSHRHSTMPHTNNKVIDVNGACQKISWRGCWCVGGSLVAVVVVVLLVVEGAVLEGLVPFLVPVTNSICGNKHSTSERQSKRFDCRACCANDISANKLQTAVYCRVGDKWSRASNWHDHSGLRSGSLWVKLLVPCCDW